MRRAALQVVRQPRRPLPRRAFRHRAISFTPQQHHVAGSGAAGLRAFASRRAPPAASAASAAVPKTATSPMHGRSLSAALAAAAVAGGAWYLQQRPLHADSGISDPRGLRSSSSVAESYPSATVGQTATPATRRALVVEQGQLYSGTIVGDGPLSKDTDDYGRKVLEMLTPEQATQKLRKNEESWLVGRGKGVVRYDVVQIPSNDPIEDDHAEKIIEVPQEVASTADGEANSDWMFWGVYDGHSGWTTSAKLRQTLISFVARELNNTYLKASQGPTALKPLPESIDAAIKNGFLRLDTEIVHESVAKVMQAKSKRVAAELLAPALSGSCALLSFYDSHSKLLRVACTGDSRAVLGRRGQNGKWTATPLSEDQTGGTASEAARLRSEHPGEPQVVQNGRVLGGLEPTRAFGDAVYKWTSDVQEKLKQSFFVRSPNKLLRTPPYVTAEPIVTTTKMDPKKGDFVVMATDGLWEMLTNEEVVGLVGQWLEEQGQGINGASTNTTSAAWLKSWFGAQKPKLPVESTASEEDKSGQRAPIRQQQWGVKTGMDQRFVVKDQNAATHLVRNALGGNDEDQLCALLTLPSPSSRRFRDDLTVQVIFFGEGETNGDVTLNKEASAAAEDVKPKL